MRGETYALGTNRSKTLSSLLAEMTSFARNILETSRELLDNADPGPMESVNLLSFHRNITNISIISPDVVC